MQAHGILLDRKAKREYDRQLIREEGSSSFFVRPFRERQAAPIVPTVKPPDAPPEPVPEEGVSGAWLSTMRERRGVTLDELSDISKVGVTYLKALEQEQFDALPEPVYVRGFLIAYARTLNLDATAVAGAYLELMKR
jgi:flagellar biosynthesis protein FlhG